jgi:hypothetical protein
MNEEMSGRNVVRYQHEAPASGSPSDEATARVSRSKTGKNARQRRELFWLVVGNRVLRAVIFCLHRSARPSGGIGIYTSRTVLPSPPKGRGEHGSLGLANIVNLTRCVDTNAHEGEGR